MGARGRHERCRRSRPQFRLQKWLETQQVGKCESLARSLHDQLLDHFGDRAPPLLVLDPIKPHELLSMAPRAMRLTW